MIEDLINKVDSLIFDFVHGSFGSLTGTIETVWKLMFIVFIAFYGYKVIISGRFSVPDLLVHSFKIVIILVLATQWDTFFTFVYKLVTDSPSDLAGIIISGASNSSSDPVATDTISANQALTHFYNRSMTVASKILEGASWNDLQLYIYAGVICMGAIGFTGYAAMLIILAKLAVGLLLAVGPVFILLLIFNNTRNLFEGWLRTLLNYAIIPVFVYGLLALLLMLAEAPLRILENNSNPDSELMTYIGPFLLITFISILLLSQIMNIAASVTGGISLSTMGSFARTMQFARNAPSTFNRAARSTGRASYITYRSVRAPKETFNSARGSISQSLKNIREFKG